LLPWSTIYPKAATDHPYNESTHQAAAMSSKPVPTKDATADQEVARRDDPKAAPVDMKFEIVVIPVSDVDRALRRAKSAF
jgi:hypothetical protein